MRTTFYIITNTYRQLKYEIIKANVNETRANLLEMLKIGELKEVIEIINGKAVTLDYYNGDKQ
jgi:hypothetical protein